MRRAAADEPATALRAALGSPWPELQVAARGVIQAALQAGKWQDVASVLGVSVDTLDRLRRDFPSVFAGRRKSTKNRRSPLAHR